MERIVKFQFEDFCQALKEHNHVRLSGFCRFSVLQSRVVRKMRRIGLQIRDFEMMIELIDSGHLKKEPWHREKLAGSLRVARVEYEKLKKRLDESGLERLNGGSMELHVCKAVSGEDLPGEDTDM